MHPVRRLQQIIRDAEQLVVDVQEYNRLHPEHPPLDCEWDRLMLHAARKCLAAWQSPEYDRRYRELMMVASQLRDKT